MSAYYKRCTITEKVCRECGQYFEVSSDHLQNIEPHLRRSYTQGQLVQCEGSHQSMLGQPGRTNTQIRIKSMIQGEW